MVDGFFVVGPRAGVAAARKTAEGGDSLGDADGYREALEDLNEERVAHLWVDGPKALKTWSPGGDPGRLGDGPGVAELLVKDDTATVQVVAGIASMRRAGLLASGADTNSLDLLSEVPERALVAAAVPGLGARAGRLRRRLDRALGADTGSLLGDLGDTVLYLGRVDSSYPGEPTVEAALGARTKDPDGYLQRVGRVVGRLPGVNYRFRPSNTTSSREPSADVRLPDGGYVDLEARSDDGLFVPAYGLSATAMFASPPLGDTGRYRSALRRLGKGFRPTLFVDLRGALTALGRAGVGIDPPPAPRRYLQRVDSVMAGDRAAGDRLTTRLTINLR